jgi:hypothetical protein
MIILVKNASKDVEMGFELFKSVMMAIILMAMDVLGIVESSQILLVLGVVRPHLTTTAILLDKISDY